MALATVSQRRLPCFDCHCDGRKKRLFHQKKKVLPSTDISHGSATGPRLHSDPLPDGQPTDSVPSDLRGPTTSSSSEEEEEADAKDDHQVQDSDYDLDLSDYDYLFDDEEEEEKEEVEEGKAEGDAFFEYEYSLPPDYNLSGEWAGLQPRLSQYNFSYMQVGIFSFQPLFFKRLVFFSFLFLVFLLFLFQFIRIKQLIPAPARLFAVKVEGLPNV